MIHAPVPAPAAGRATAFTLLELLVVVSIIAVLAGLLLPALRAVQARGDRVAAVSQMRQIAAAGLAEYPADHNGKLPGPLFPGQIPTLDPARDGRLALILAPYLGIPIPATPQLEPLFVPPAYRRAVTPAFLGNDARTYVMNMAVPVNGSLLNPWGNAQTGVGDPFPAGTAPGQAWAFSDVDQLHPRVAATWKANTPPAKVHGARRLAVRFDGSAGEIDDGELAVPTP